MVDAEGSLRVPIRVVRAEVAFGTGTPRLFELFAPAGADGRPDRACVAELLGRSQRFLPAREVETGALVTLGARTISWIAVPIERATAMLGDEELFEHRRDVEIELVGGARLEGELLYSAPAASARVLDVLNAAGRFVPLWLADRVIYFNEALVCRVTEVPHRHRPSSPGRPTRLMPTKKKKKKKKKARR